ncbi:MAG: hypothetical protein H0X40_01040 [Chthoniobacterales bacterium]|nr:hypothetical protein [Chthoniobacterales bacterium]
MKPSVITNADTNTFDVTLFPCVTVTRSFFVGFIITQSSNQFPAAFDTTSPLSNRSFVAGNAAGAGDIVTLSNNTLLPLNTVESYGPLGNFMIRADACVPDLSTMTLATLGGLAGLIGGRRKLRNLFAARSYPGHARGSAGVIIVGGHRNASRSQSGTRAAITLPRSLTRGGALRPALLRMGRAHI